jgi:peptidoglycan/LPS O-acetylase OafA/YrhL
MLAHGATFEATYKMTICRCDSLLAGACLALLVRGPGRSAVLRAALPMFWIASLLCVMIGIRSGNFNWERNWTINTIGYTLLAVCGTSLIAMVLREGITSSLMNWRVLRWLGRYSYGIYIFHMMLGGVYVGFLTSHIHSKIILHAALPLANLIITLPLAWLSFRLYEQPFLRLKRYFGPA